MDDAGPDPRNVPRPVPRSARGFLRSQIRWILAVATLVLLLAAAVLPTLISSPERVSRFIADVVPELQADVRIGTVKIGWFGPIVLADLRVVPRDGAAVPIAIRRIEGSHGLAGILFSAGDLGRIRIDGLEADVVFQADRRSNLAGLFRPAGDVAVPGADARRAAAPGAVRRSPFRTSIEIEDAMVRIAGPWTPEPWVSDPIDVRATLAPHERGAWSEWTIEPVQLLTNARLEPGVAQGVLAYIAPVLADATRTAGNFSLRLDGARLPVGQPESGTLAGELAMHEVVLGPGPMVARMIASLPGSLPEPPAIRIADEAHVAFRLAEQRVWHKGLEFGLPLAKPGQRLDVESSGSVGLVDGALDLLLELPIPADLPQDRPLLAALSGKTVSIGIGGELGAPQVKFNGSIKAAAGEVVTDLVERLRARAQSTEPDETEPVAESTPRPAAPRAGESTADQVLDIVGGVLDEVARRRAERRAADPDAAPPPRRGGLLRRLVQPPSPTPPPPDPARPPAPTQPPAS